MLKIIKNFKGGSLSATTLIQNDDNEFFVRKSVSLIENMVFKDGILK